MDADATQRSGNYQMIRLLFVIGLIGLMVASIGISWLVIGHAEAEYQLAQRNSELEHQLAQRAALYKGTWVNKGSGLLSSMDIMDSKLRLTIHVVDNLGYEGTNNGTFTGEPFSISIIISSPFTIAYNMDITMILNNGAGTQLKVVANTRNYILEKKSS